jgi:hypothetical protein
MFFNSHFFGAQFFGSNFNGGGIEQSIVYTVDAYQFFHPGVTAFQIYVV